MSEALILEQLEARRQAICPIGFGCTRVGRGTRCWPFSPTTASCSRGR